MERVKVVERAGIQYLYLDLSGLDPDRVLVEIDQARSTIRSGPPKSALILMDVTDGRFDTAVARSLTEFAKGNAPFVKASAVIGISGLQKVLLSGIQQVTGRKFGVFDTREAAEQYLIQFNKQEA